MILQKFDIFSVSAGSAVWIDAVEGLDDADSRMKALAAKLPGSYFIFSPSTNRIVASVDTSEQAPSSTERR